MNRLYVRNRKLKGCTESIQVSFDINGLAYADLERGYDLCMGAAVWTVDSLRLFSPGCIK